MVSEEMRHAESTGESEFYTEPAEMRGRDIAGVILALLALGLIGLGGYVWLNPDLSYRDLLRRARPDTSSMAPSDTASAGGASESAGSDKGMPAASGAPEQDTASCPYCGMFTAPSESHIRASWSNGSSSDHDCWDCTFNWAAQEGLSLDTASVRRYGSPPEAVEWLDAGQAVYLYGVKELKGSMPPYVAAFADRASAEAARPGLGGELLDWAGLQARFGGSK